MTIELGKRGVRYLAKRHRLTSSRGRFGKFRDVLVIEDNIIAANRLAATMRVLLGYDLEVRLARTLNDSLVLLAEKAPDVVIVGDKPTLSIDALQVIPQLKESGYGGPIVVVGGQMTPPRKAKLLTLGASDALHKDDVDSVRLAEALWQSCEPLANGAAIEAN